MSTRSIDSSLTETHICPRCRLAKFVLLKSMRAYDRTRDWFKCDSCEHVFTTPRVIEFNQDNRAAS